MEKFYMYIYDIWTYSQEGSYWVETIYVYIYTIYRYIYIFLQVLKNVGNAVEICVVCTYK